LGKTFLREGFHYCNKEVLPDTNSSASPITLTQGAGTTLRLGGTATTGNRTIAAYGVVSVQCVGTEEFYVTGNVT
jgi:hypothetical protein